jgi:exosortase A-associated hydrolase 1
MNRQHLTFQCDGATLLGTLDTADAATGLLIVSGGNEVRSGAWSGQALFARRIAEEGFPVFRFDRRGVGDSEGFNGEFRSSGPDISAALRAFRESCPHIERIVGMGNCDGASALMLTHGAGFDGLVLSNPWTIENDDAGEAPPAAVRDHYRRRLADPAAIKRLLSGQVSLGKLFSSLLGAIKPGKAPGGLAAEIAQGIAPFTGPVIFPIAERDRTAQAFLASWDSKDKRIRRCPDATHSFVEVRAQGWLAQQALDLLREV